MIVADFRLNKKTKSKKQRKDAVCLTGKGEKYTIPNYPIRKYQKVTGLFRKAIETKPFDKMDKCNSHYSEPT
jgi:hypothetical protein